MLFVIYTCLSVSSISILPGVCYLPERKRKNIVKLKTFRYNTPPPKRSYKDTPPKGK